MRETRLSYDDEEDDANREVTDSPLFIVQGNRHDSLTAVTPSYYKKEREANSCGGLCN